MILKYLKNNFFFFCVGNEKVNNAFPNFTSPFSLTKNFLKKITKKRNFWPKIHFGCLPN